VKSESEPDLIARLRVIPEPAGEDAGPLPRPRGPESGAAPERATVRKRRLIALAGSVAWVGTHLAVYGVRSDFDDLSPLYLLAQVFLPLAFAIVSLMVALAPGRLGLGMRIGLIGALALLGPATLPHRVRSAPALRGPGWRSGLARYLDLLRHHRRLGGPPSSPRRVVASRRLRLGLAPSQRAGRRSGRLVRGCHDESALPERIFLARPTGPRTSRGDRRRGGRGISSAPSASLDPRGPPN
jgi:hypothetical protein